MQVTHRIETTYDDKSGRAYWECDCGIAGSCPEITADLHSDKHIPDGDMRVDVHRGREW